MLTALVGILSALLGVTAGAVLSAFFYHREWINNQKKQEYRQVLDQLYETISAVELARPSSRFPEDPQPLSRAYLPLARIFEDRIFITQTAKNSGAYDDWLALKKVILYEPQLDLETPPELRYSFNNLRDREDALRRKILKCAKDDIVRFRPWSSCALWNR